MSAQHDPSIEAEQRYAEDDRFAAFVEKLHHWMSIRGWSVGDVRQAVLVIERKEREAEADTPVTVEKP